MGYNLNNAKNNMVQFVVKILKAILTYAKKSALRNIGFSRGALRFGRKLASGKGFANAIGSWVKTIANDKIPIYRYWNQFKTGQDLKKKKINTSGMERIGKRLLINKLTPIEFRKTYYFFNHMKSTNKNKFLDKLMLDEYKKLRGGASKQEKQDILKEVQGVKKSIKSGDIESARQQFYQMNKVVLESPNIDTKTKLELMNRIKYLTETKTTMKNIDADLSFIPNSPITNNFGYTATWNTKTKTLTLTVLGNFYWPNSGYQKLTPPFHDNLAKAKLYQIVKQNIELDTIMECMSSGDFGTEIWPWLRNM